MTDPQNIAERYLEAFNETDPDRRRRLIEDLYTADGRYTDPNVVMDGPDAIEGFVTATQEAFPGYRFTLGGPVDAHHDQARFQWHATAPDADEPEYVGFDVLVTDGADRVHRVYGFLDKVPEATG